MIKMVGLAVPAPHPPRNRGGVGSKGGKGVARGRGGRRRPPPPLCCLWLCRLPPPPRCRAGRLLHGQAGRRPWMGPARIFGGSGGLAGGFQPLLSACLTFWSGMDGMDGCCTAPLGIRLRIIGCVCHETEMLFTGESRMCGEWSVRRWRLSSCLSTCLLPRRAARVPPALSVALFPLSALAPPPRCPHSTPHSNCHGGEYGPV